jgi:hypothetical protein
VFTEHASEGVGVEIKPLVINQDIELSPTEIKVPHGCISLTSLNLSLPMSQSLKKGVYNVVIVLPEQIFCDPTSGATPRLIGGVQEYRGPTFNAIP